MEELLQRDYLMSDATLAGIATNFATFATNDLADLAQFGITAGKITALVAKQNAFEDFPPDFDLAGQVTEATQAKDAKRAEIQLILDQISARVNLEYAANKGRQNRFGFERLGNSSDELYLTRVEQIADLAEEFLADLTDRGQTQGQIDDLRDLRTEFKSLVSAKVAAEETRRNATRDRVVLGNELYAMVKEISIAGKAAYANTNYAKYQKYIIYDSDVPQTPPGAIAGMGYDVQTQKAYWNDSATETSYEAEIDENGVISEVTIGEDVTELTIAMGATMKRVRIRARNAAGVGPSTEWLEIPAAAQPPMPTNLQYKPEENGNPGITTADAPAGATDLRMFYQPDGHPKTEIGVMTNGAYPWTLWLIPGTIFVQAEFPGGVVSAQATLRVE